MATMYKFGLCFKTLEYACTGVYKSLNFCNLLGFGFIHLLQVRVTVNINAQILIAVSLAASGRGDGGRLQTW